MGLFSLQGEGSSDVESEVNASLSPLTDGFRDEGLFKHSLGIAQLELEHMSARFQFNSTRKRLTCRQVVDRRQLILWGQKKPALSKQRDAVGQFQSSPCSQGENVDGRF